MTAGEPKCPTSPSDARWDRAAVILCALGMLASLVLRVIFLLNRGRIDASIPEAFLAGEGLVGLVARHIQAGARPVFVYGQCLNGTLEQYVQALVFALAGSSWTTLRLVPALCATAVIPLAGVIAARLYGRHAGYMAALLVALPSKFIFEWGCVAWGTLIYVPLFFLALHLFVKFTEERGDRPLATMSAALGLATWAYQVMIGYLALFVGALLLWARPSRRQLVVALLAGTLGLSPLLYQNVTKPLCTVKSLLTRVHASKNLQARVAERTEANTKFFRSVPLFQALGAQPRQDGEWSVSGSASALVLVVAAACGIWTSFHRRREDPAAFCGATLVLACVGINILQGLPGFSGQPLVRYHYPLYPLLCVLAAGGFDRFPRFGTCLVGIIALGNTLQLAMPVQAAARTPNRVVINALLQEGLHYGYGADNMYDIVFESNERVIIEPLEWTRYQPYKKAVARADRIFYLYRNNQTNKVSYHVLRKYLKNHDVTYKSMEVGDYHIMYDFVPHDSLQHDLDPLRDEIRRRKVPGDSE
jgi:hypothetical protein